MIIGNSGGNTKRSGLTRGRSEVEIMGLVLVGKDELRKWPNGSPRPQLEMTYRPLGRWGDMISDEVNYPETSQL
jgi:hypothetical protein